MIMKLLDSAGCETPDRESIEHGDLILVLGGIPYELKPELLVCA